MVRSNLQKFIDAQSKNYNQALTELKNGNKLSHWIWYVFPQIVGLGGSAMAQKYAIASQEEATEYLNHKVLGKRLLECCNVLCLHKGKRIEDIMGFPDHLKLCSSMTLFHLVSGENNIFLEVLDGFYQGELDVKTVNFLHSNIPAPHKQ